MSIKCVHLFRITGKQVAVSGVYLKLYLILCKDVGETLNNQAAVDQRHPFDAVGQIVVKPPANQRQNGNNQLIGGDFRRDNGCQRELNSSAGWSAAISSWMLRMTRLVPWLLNRTRKKA